MFNFNNVSVTQIKDQNVYLVKRALRQVEIGTKQTIAQLTGLSVSTCNNILTELLNNGEVTLKDPASVRVVGRPAFTYVFNGDFKYVCCLSASWDAKLQTTFFHYTIQNLTGHIVEEKQITCASISYQEIEALLQQLVIRYPKIDTICFGTSGFYDSNRWSSARTFAMLDGTDILIALSEHLNRKILVENDVNAIAYGIFNSELSSRYNMDSMVTAAFFNAKGTGAGIIYHGKIMHGSHNFAGEIGYTDFDGKYPDDLMETGEASIVTCAGKLVESITTILNPSTCFLIGEYMTQELVDKIKHFDYGRIPTNVMPEIVYLEHYQDYFSSGLYEIALDSALNAPDPFH